MTEFAEKKLNTIMVRPDGPLVASGDIEVLDADGKLIYQGDEMALCRCGASGNKPFCDGSHKERGFIDDAQFSDLKKEYPEGTGKLTIQCRANAMLLVKGPMQIYSRDGNSMTTRNRAALCRCGASENKPFCDARHKQCGFSAD